MYTSKLYYEGITSLYTSSVIQLYIIKFGYLRIYVPSIFNQSIFIFTFYCVICHLSCLLSDEAYFSHVPTGL